jgi:serralysin
MCGYCKSFGVVSATGDEMIDGLMSGGAWGGPVTYAFPASAASYAYGGEIDANFSKASTTQQNAASFALDQLFGSAANDGFSIEGFTAVDISVGLENDATIRAAQSSLPSTAYAYLPGEYMEAGDVWLGANAFLFPKAGNYGWHTVLHEMGHAMGLKHGHEGLGSFGVLPSDYDTLEKTIMTYRTYEGGNVNGYTYEHWGAPQTFMMADIAALQHMYGADFETNAGDTVYSWKQGEGHTYVDGDRAIRTGGDVIFATIWDGGGVDTYDLSKFKSALNINLEPGEASVFSHSQLSDLGRGHKASGNIYNALQYEGDVRSLIENAIGGRGADTITGNSADNELTGLKDGDKLYGHDGNDTLYGGAGRDVLWGHAGNDQLFGGSDDDRLIGGYGDDILTGGAGKDTFIFSGETGADTIVDFRDGSDKLSIISESPTAVADIIASAVQVGSDVTLTIAEGATVTIQNFDLASLDAKDFLL